MSTELSNGVIIPEEYSDDWYDEMSINLRKLNDVITAASDNATDIQRLDTDKANQSDLTALTSRVSQNETDIIALQTAVSGALKREIVQTLPTEDISTTTIYMIRNSESSGTNIYDEYMYINSQWELIGTSATDFSNYYTKNETDNLLSGKADDNSVVHLSGTETISGPKTFSNTATFASVNIEDIRWKSLVNQTVDLNDCYVSRSGAISGYYTTDISSGANISNKAVNTAFTMLSLTTRRVSASDYQVRQVFYGSGAKYIRTCSNGTWTAWVNETDKFVTTDTDQSVSGQKVFSDINAISSSAEIGASAGNNSFKILDKNKKTISRLEGGTFSSGMAYSYLLVNNGSDVFNGFSLYQSSSSLAQLRPYSSTLSLQLGSSNRSFYDCYTSKINGLTPSSMSIPNFSGKVDITSYISNLTGATNNYTPSVNGWIYVGSNDASYLALFDTGSGGSGIRFSDGVVGEKYACIPCQASRTLGIRITCTNLVVAYFIPCLGNI